MYACISIKLQSHNFFWADKNYDKHFVLLQNRKPDFI